MLDTHVHVVSPDRQRYAVLGDPPDWPSVTVESLIAEMDTIGVSRAMLVQSFFTYGFDNSFAIDCATAVPERFQVVAVIDQTASDAPEVLSDLVQNHGVRGVRFMPKGMPEGVLWDPATFPVWERAGELGIPITIAAEIQHISKMPAVVERFPDVTVCFEHMWGIEIDKPPFTAIEGVVELARFENVKMKLAPNNSFAARDAGVEPRQLYGHLIDHFGIGRLMWGSNYPAHPARFGTYPDRLAIMKTDLAFLSEADSAAFFGGNAETIWPATTNSAVPEE
jgi:L-fuconolactonase